MSVNKLVLSPAEFSGEPNTFVCGRVVLMRGPFLLTDANPGNSQKKGSGKKKDNVQKLEVHLLGGPTVGDVLFLDAWSDAALQLKKKLELQGVYRIGGAKVVNQTPRNSTSRLTYFIRAQAPIGVKTLVEKCTEGPWTDLPMRHPFTPFESLSKVADVLPVCIIGVITFQPGTMARTTMHGNAVVCNAVIKQKDHEIRCAFWRKHAEALAQFPEKQAVALMHVNVKSKGDAWELAATEATQISECPAELAEDLIASTTLDGTVASTSLSKRFNIDYSTCEAKPCTVSAIAAVLQPGCNRSLSGVYEMHAVAIMGVAGVQDDDSWQMLSCAECKKKVSDECNKCEAHPTAGIEKRYVLSVDLADQSGACAVMVYHDVVATLDFMMEDSTDPKQKRKMVRRLRSVPWTLRCVFKENVVRESNYIEVKYMTPSVSEEGIVETWQPHALPMVRSNNACPVAKCADIKYDKDLGLALVADRPVAAVRVLVILQTSSEDEEVAVPDESQSGLRVCRKARCALQPDIPAAYSIKTAGLSSSVQWLLTAPAGTVLFITSALSNDELSFNVLAHWEVNTSILPDMKHFLMCTIHDVTSINLQLDSQQTPLKRQRALDETGPSKSNLGSLAIRRRVA